MPLNRRQFFSFSRKPLRRPEGYWLHVYRTAMACRFEVTLPLTDRAGVEVARLALNEIDQIEDQLSVFRDTSEVSFINRAAFEDTTPVETRLFELLTLARRIHIETGGAFDITSGPLTRCWGFYRRQGRIPSVSELQEARDKTGMRHVELNESLQSVRFSVPGVEVNLGAIGKGYAIDRVAGLMCSQGTRTALLSAGNSSVLAIGKGVNSDGWLVGLRHPLAKKIRMGSMRLRNCAMATSGIGEQYFVAEGKRYGHIIDPRSGLPSEGVAAVTVVTPSAALADALSTAFFVGGKKVAEEYCSNHAQTLALIIEEGNHTQPLVFGSNTGCTLEIP
jgi:FAD:protein FMN transferase